MHNQQTKKQAQQQAAKKTTFRESMLDWILVGNAKEAQIAKAVETRSPALAMLDVSPLKPTIVESSLKKSCTTFDLSAVETVNAQDSPCKTVNEAQNSMVLPKGVSCTKTYTDKAQKNYIWLVTQSNQISKK